jgi:hypothetical protein
MSYKYNFKNFLFMSSFISFYPTQGYPSEVFSIHSDNYPITWIWRCCNKVPIPNAFLSLYLHAPISTTWTSFLFIIPQHQPFIVSILPKDYLPTMVSYWHSKNQQLLAQLVHLPIFLKLLKINKIRRKACLHLFPILLLILLSTILLCKPPFNVAAPCTIHSFV